MELITTNRIEGECKGFDGDRIFELVNGQKWQQAVYKYKYRYKFRPVAKIWRDGGCYYIDIEGMGEMIKVRRI